MNTLSWRHSLRTAAAIGAALAVLVLASARLAAQEVVEAPPPVPVVSAMAEGAALGAGRAEVFTQDYDWFDARRNRAVPVRLYLPSHTADLYPHLTPSIVRATARGGDSREGRSASSVDDRSE